MSKTGGLYMDKQAEAEAHITALCETVKNLTIILRYALLGYDKETVKLGMSIIERAEALVAKVQP